VSLAATTRWEWLCRGLGAVPFLFLGVMLVEALFLRLVLGRFPVYPESVDGWVVPGLDLVGAGLFWVAWLGWPLLLLVPLGQIRNGRWKRFVPWPFVFALGVCSVLAVSKYDPTTFCNWFWD
jgi:hypothetical protein